MKKDLDFIAGEFFDYDIPKSKYYLWKYYTTDVQRQFVRYYLMFGSTERFVAHTGCFCRKRWLQLLVVKFKRLEAALQKAREELDFSTVAAIESGNYVL